MQATQTDFFELPPELWTKPLALIGVSGLDVRNNAIHKSIWETLTSNRSDVVPVTYKLIDNAYVFPVVKPKRNSYEWYIPKGILKQNWLDKHLNKIPATVVIFYDLDWDDAQWSEKMIECASRVQSMRIALEGRGTKLAVVLIQNKPPMPTGEDALATERATALCASCELHSKCLYMLPHGDHLQGYAVRLENAFYDMAQNYYHLEAKYIKSHREHLNKSTHQFLFVRHQFKMGVLNELRQDIRTAHKHFTHAYNNLMEIRIVDTNANEIRMVAGFINYKLCRIMFALNLARDAIALFKTHMDRFKTRIGFQELAFEHHAWLSKQYSVFGDIFDEAVKQGLPAVQTQHPGLYYQQAIQHAILRKQMCKDLCSDVSSYPVPDPLVGMNEMEFYGQRPWRPGKISSDPPDPQIENNGIKALQYLEKQVNHSTLTIGLYGLAISQFKIYRCPRTRRILVVEMADEYYNSGDYGKALTLLTHMLWDYRSECWWSLLSNILQKALRCAYISGKLEDFVILSLELLGRKITVGNQEKDEIYENLKAVLRKQCPTSSIKTTNTDSLWNQVLKDKVHCSIEMKNVASCVDCKARFMQDRYQADEKIMVEIFVRNASEYALLFLGINVVVNDNGNSTEYGVDHSSPTNPSLLFQSSDCKKFVLKFNAKASYVNTELKISSVHLLLGNTWDAVFNLQYSGLGNMRDSIPLELMHFRKTGSDDFESIRPVLAADIVPRNSKLTMKFEHAKPALLEEWYRIDVHVTNERDSRVSNLKFDVGLADNDGVDITEFAKNVNCPPEKAITYQLSDLNPSDTSSLHFYIRAYQAGERNILIKASFNMLLNEQIPCVTEETVHVSIVKPFDVAAKFYSHLFEEISKLYVGEEFLVMPVISCSSPWPIVIEDSRIEFDDNIDRLQENVASQVKGIELTNGESGTEFYLAATRKRSDTPVTVGKYIVQWKRVNGILSTTTVHLTGYAVDWIPLDVRLILPAYGYVRTPVPVDYSLTNRSHHLVKLDASVDGSEAFMFAGYKQFQITILPNSTKTLKYNLYPLIAGNVGLPKLVLTITEGTESPSLRQEHLNKLLLRSLPTHMYVMPQIKGDEAIKSPLSSAPIAAD